MVPDTIFEQLRRVKWPDAFVVEYRSGDMELLLQGEGVCLTPAGDDPEGIGGLDADIPKRSRHQQHKGGRYVSFRDLRALYSTDGAILWKRY